MTLSALIIQANNIFEAGIAVWFMTQYFSEKQAGKRSLVPVLTAAVLYIWLNVSLSLSVDDFLIMAVCFFVLFCYSGLCLQGSVIQHFILALICQLLLPVVNICFVQILAFFFGVSVAEYVNPGNYGYFLGIIITKIIYAMVLQVFLMIFRKNKLILPRRYTLAVSGIFMCMIVTEGTLYYVMKYGGLEPQFASGMVGISIGLLGIAMFQFFSIYKINQGSVQEEERKLLKLQNEYQDKYIKEMQWTEKQLGRMRHDYKNHVNNMISLLENGRQNELRSYLENVGAYYLADSIEYINTGNPVLDAVLNTKFAVCREEKIKSSCICMGDYQPIESFCLSTILCNLLDNAIEASKKEDDGKEIVLEMKMDANYISILVKNKLRVSVLENNPYLYTTKSEKSIHGLGIQHIKELVSSQNGMYEIFEEGGFFCMHIMIPTSRLVSVA